LERRQAQPGDADEIVSWFSSAAEAILWGGPQVPAPLTSQWLIEEFEKGGYWVWVGHDGNPAGVFGLIFLDDDLAHLARFALAPNLRGRGLARHCIEEVKSLARSMGARRLALGVYGSNRIALHIYKTMGFHLVGDRAASEDTSGVSYKMKLDL
jgi:ribosomal protein S18 acetylase RimI-like enzyme